MRILFVTSEAFPLIKTGGLADVSGSLPDALQKNNQDVRILIPAYPAVLSKIINPTHLTTIKDLPKIGEVEIILGTMPETGVKVMAIKSPSLYERDGGPYIDNNGADWVDNPLRFGILSLVAARLSNEESPLSDWIPDIVHCNDWQTGLTPAYMHYYRANRPQMKQAKSVLSIHNLAFQGNYHADWLSQLYLPDESFQMRGLEFYGQLSFLKAGIFYSDRLLTVSPTYAKEIQTEQFGFGMQGLLRERSHDIHGILNGLDTTEWNPATDPYLIKNYDDQKLAGKKAVKKSLQTKLGLEINPAIPLFGVVSRLTHQKGLDILLSCAERLLNQHVCQIAVLGNGEPVYESGYQKLAAAYKGRVSVTIGYNEELSHQIMAGSDLFLMPSRFEPCGLNQMYGLRYGTPPIVNNTGGLADSVTDTNEATLTTKTANGFVMEQADAAQLTKTIERALDYFKDQKMWKKIQQNGMRKNLDWSESAEKYISIYQSLIDE